MVSDHFLFSRDWICMLCCLPLLLMSAINLSTFILWVAAFWEYGRSCHPSRRGGSSFGTLLLFHITQMLVWIFQTVLSIAAKSWGPRNWSYQGGALKKTWSIFLSLQARSSWVTLYLSTALARWCDISLPDYLRRFLFFFPLTLPWTTIGSPHFWHNVELCLYF